MSDRYEEVEFVSWGDRLVHSVATLSLGVILFIFSFWLLIWNEGRIDLSQVAKSATELSALRVEQNAVGKLVTVTGAISGLRAISDSQFIQPVPYVVLDRTVEMYAWDEDSNTTTEKHQDGSETKRTTYTYDREWTNDPEDSNEFRYSAGHENPPMSVKEQIYKATNAMLGVYQVDMTSFKQVLNHRSSCVGGGTTYQFSDPKGGITLPENSYVNLLASNLTASAGQLVDGYLFQGNGKPQQPIIGDLRICYAGLPNQATVTLLGQIGASAVLTPGTYRNVAVYRLLPGDRRAAISELKSEYRLWLWVFRLAGFLCMATGLTILLEPLCVMLSIIPFVGRFFESLVGGAGVAMAFVLSGITILVASLTSHLGVLLVALGVAVLVMMFSSLWRSHPS
jgi:hypothetical protein